MSDYIVSLSEYDQEQIQNILGILIQILGELQELRQQQEKNNPQQQE